ncbi:MAG: glycosyltransferase [Myxococcales bacterium]|nr:glycosyltransferase [Myxococcales bacterium]
MLACLYFLIALVIRYFGLLWFSYLASIEGHSDFTDHQPLISIIVPAYNEGPVIQQALRSLFNMDYPRYEIIVVDDGSTDDTYARAMLFEGDHGQVLVRVIQQSNSGKWAALNAGISASRGEFVLCMDGDSTLDPAALSMAARHFGNPAVGAVAGNVRIANQRSLITRLQSLEYIEGLNLVRRAQGFFHAVNVVPGPIGIFRRSALDSVGGYDGDTFAEDCDLTLKLLVEGWRTVYEPDAKAYTEAPESLNDLIKQRYRWTRGILQSIVKHRRALIRPQHYLAVTATLWYMIFEGLIWPAMNVFTQCFFVFLVYKLSNPFPLVYWFVQLTLLDVAAALYCVAAEREKIGLIFYATLYRVYFSLTIDFAKLFATIEEALRIRMDWGKLERIGRI